MAIAPAPAKRGRRRSARHQYSLEEQVGFILRQVAQRHAVIFAQHIEGDLTPTQFAALVKLSSEEPISQNLLGRITAMDAATIKGVIDRLSARGYIEARPDLEDARLRLLSLTELGRFVVERAIPSAIAITEETLAPLTPEEREAFLSLLRKLV